MSIPKAWAELGVDFDGAAVSSITRIEEDVFIAQTVSITVGTAAPIVVPWQSAMNVQTALEIAYNEIQSSSAFSFACQFFGTYQGPPYGPLGYMVIMLNGVYDLPNQGQYWALLVNGAYASKGIDLIPLNPGDQVSFLNQIYSAETHAASAVQFRHEIHHPA